METIYSVSNRTSCFFFKTKCSAENFMAHYSPSTGFNMTEVAVFEDHEVKDPYAQQNNVSEDKNG